MVRAFLPQGRNGNISSNSNFPPQGLEDAREEVLMLYENGDAMLYENGIIFMEYEHEFTPVSMLFQDGIEMLFQDGTEMLFQESF